MILVDTSVWIHHLRSSDATLVERLGHAEVLCHPFVVGELALGGLGRRAEIIDALQGLPKALVASDKEVLTFIEASALAGRGIGYVDAHLLAAVRLTADAVLWTRDTRLHEAAATLGIAFEPE